MSKSAMAPAHVVSLAASCYLAMLSPIPCRANSIETVISKFLHFLFFLLPKFYHICLKSLIH